MQPIRPRVLLAIYDPLVPGSSGQKVRSALGFGDPAPLTAGFIQDVAETSGGHLRYVVVDAVMIDGYPRKQDGFRYSAEAYLTCWQGQGIWHQPDNVDYADVFATTDALRRVETEEIDEVWLWGGPYFGFWESTLAGPGAHFCNSPPVEGVSCGRRFVTMGFNYERGVGEMLEAFGHRAESMLAHAFGSWREWGGTANHAWDQFSAYERVAPGRAGCGTVHFAPNSRVDYDWGNREPVLSTCDGWPGFPPAPTTRREVDCREWGDGDVRAHHRWWLAHLPRGDGESGGVRNNWWSYLLA